MKTTPRMCIDKDAAGNFVAEASDLGMRDWPASIEHEGLAFAKAEPIWTGQGEDREIGGWFYRSGDKTFTVFND